MGVAIISMHGVLIAPMQTSAAQNMVSRIRQTIQKCFIVVPALEHPQMQQHLDSESNQEPG